MGDIKTYRNQVAIDVIGNRLPNSSFLRKMRILKFILDRKVLLIAKMTIPITTLKIDII